MNAAIVLSQVEVMTYVGLALAAIAIILWKKERIIDAIVGDIDCNPNWDDEQ